MLYFFFFRGWFVFGFFIALFGLNFSIMDFGSGDKDRNMVDKWSFFGLRFFQKFDSGKEVFLKFKQCGRYFIICIGNCLVILRLFFLRFIFVGGFVIQIYRGVQKFFLMDLIRAQVIRMVEDLVIFKLFKMDILVIEGKK